MQSLFTFLYRFRVFFFFVFLELICFWLIASYNNYYNSFFFNSSNQVAGGIQKTTYETRKYFELQKINQSLAEENSRLRLQLYNRIGTATKSDSVAMLYEVIPANVINNDFRRSANYMTLDKGENDGVRPGMGVISLNGAIGSVKSTSGNFSTVTSLLHQNQMISSEIQRSGTLCTTQWDASDPTHAKVNFIPRHVEIGIGDSIVTSGFNAIFPPGIPIGIIESFDLTTESVFYDVTIKLSNDFSSLQNVYVVTALRKTEKDSVETIYE